MKSKITKLNKIFPGIEAVSTIEWDGNEGGIWFRQEGNLHVDGTPFFDYYGNPQVHPEVQKALSAMGLMAEPYDGGTWMAYEN